MIAASVDQRSQFQFWRWIFSSECAGGTDLCLVRGVTLFRQLPDIPKRDVAATAIHDVAESSSTFERARKDMVFLDIEL